MFRNLWYIAQLYADCSRIRIISKIFVMITGAIVVQSIYNKSRNVFLETIHKIQEFIGNRLRLSIILFSFLLNRLATMYLTMWSVTQLYAYLCGICIAGKGFIVTSGTIFLYCYKSFIVNNIAPCNACNPSPHKFDSVALYSGGWDTKTSQELIVEMKKNLPIYTESHKQYSNATSALKTFQRAKELDSRTSNATS